MTRRPPGAPAALIALGVSLAAFVAFAYRVDPGLRPRGAPRALDRAAEEGILATLVAFQRLYEDFFASGGSPALLDQFPATKEVRHQVFRDLGFLREAGLVFVQDLAGATVLSVEATGPRTAEALVYEEWNYLPQQASDRAPRSRLKGMGQGFRYRLRGEGDRWIVTGWDPEDVPPPPDDGGRKW